MLYDDNTVKLNIDINLKDKVCEINTVIESAASQAHQLGKGRATILRIAITIQNIMY